MNRSKVGSRLSEYLEGDLSERERSKVEAALAQMTPAFKSGKICEFDPLGPEDEDQAQLESDAVQYYVMGTNNGYLAMVSALKDILLVRNGVVCPYAEDKTERRTTTFNNVEPEAIPSLTEDVPESDYSYDADSRELTVTRETRSLPGSKRPLG